MQIERNAVLDRNAALDPMHNQMDTGHQALRNNDMDHRMRCCFLRWRN